MDSKAVYRNKVVITSSENIHKYEYDIIPQGNGLNITSYLIESTNLFEENRNKFYC